MTVYQGYDVLEVQPSRDGPKTHVFNRRFNLLDTVVGKRDSDADGPEPATEQPFMWVASGRVEIEAIKAFLHARKGRAVPFWVPSYQRDMRVTVNHGAGLAALTIRRIGYSTLMFANSNARRHLAFYEFPSSIPYYRKVLTAAESLTPGVEDITLDNVTASGLGVATSVISFLKLMRLSQDENTLEWLDNDTVRCNLMFTEVPMEAP